MNETLLYLKENEYYIKLPFLIDFNEKFQDYFTQTRKRELSPLKYIMISNEVLYKKISTRARILILLTIIHNPKHETNNYQKNVDNSSKNHKQNVVTSKPPRGTR